MKVYPGITIDEIKQEIDRQRLWLLENYNEVREKYLGSWVAVCDGMLWSLIFGH